MRPTGAETISEACCPICENDLKPLKDRSVMKCNTCESTIFYPLSPLLLTLYNSLLQE
ncbi:hypothetical protein [Paenibacillus sp. MBLB4367]|uniref:hypothetical protein n=1 Tax=Paenibacillus sp. MBLB4367 TaxID=3384767 RepID=UPI00390809FE